MRYLSFIHRDEAGYGLSFPDFPGCVSVGDTVDEAVRQGSKAPGLPRRGASGGRPGDSGTALDRCN
ncbi:MAG: type II toxin-antitoxin system HicB family antitoxin [Gammaproteobacteria bacterium]|nr:type II toxin-antitoxin system HicB family antitoxin [Gammaproteobacteria bacterium]